MGLIAQAAWGNTQARSQRMPSRGGGNGGRRHRVVLTRGGTGTGVVRRLGADRVCFLWGCGRAEISQPGGVIT